MLSDDGDELGRLSSCGVKCPQARAHTHTHKHRQERTHTHTHKHRQERTKTVIYSIDVRAEGECVLTLGRAV